jgi:hypothetical protein
VEITYNTLGSFPVSVNLGTIESERTVAHTGFRERGNAERPAWVVGLRPNGKRGFQ